MARPRRVLYVLQQSEFSVLPSTRKACVHALLEPFARAPEFSVLASTRKACVHTLLEPLHILGFRSHLDHSRSRSKPLISLKESANYVIS